MHSSEYEFLDQLGEGWAGVTWHAILRVEKFGLCIGDDIAIKIYKAEIFKAAPNIRMRIEREACTGLTVRNLNVMKVYSLEEIEVEQLGKRLALVMEFCAGGDLSGRLKSRSNYPIPDPWSTAESLTKGVHALHEAGIIHRDIKPQNTLFTNENVLRVADFGVIRHINEMTMTGSSEFLGTIRYAAPEVLNGSIATVASDVYSLGTVIYELLFGSPVFQNVTLFSKLIVEITTTKLCFPVGVNRFRKESYPMAPVLESFCRRIMAVNPSERPSTATLLSWFTTGINAPPFRQDFEATLLLVLEKNEGKWFSEDKKDYSIFSYYRALALCEKMTNDDILRFMVDHSPLIIESNVLYRQIATTYLPQGDEYLALPNALRWAVVRALKRHQRPYVMEIWDEPLTKIARDDEYMRAVLEYENLERDEEIKKALASIERITSSLYERQF